MVQLASAVPSAMAHDVEELDVQRGQTLSSIAAQYNTSVDALNAIVDIVEAAEQASVDQARSDRLEARSDLIQYTLFLLAGLAVAIATGWLVVGQVAAPIEAATATMRRFASGDMGAPIEGLVMKEGGGWEMDTFAILKGTKNLAAAQRLMDFAASRKANELYATFVSQVAMPGIASNIPNYPPGVAESMIKNDFAWASENRARIITEWTRRYEGKAAPKRN